MQNIEITASKKYKNLFQNIFSLLQKGRKKSYTLVNTTLAQTYWNIGKEIVEFQQNGEGRAEYGKKIIKKLSEDLGKGFSYRNLQQMKKFYLKYPIVQTLSAQSFLLPWSHYVRLMRIVNTEERKFYEIEAQQNNWSLREMERQFDSGLYERLVFSRNKKEVKELSEKGQIIESPEDSMKDPYILEFLGLKEEHNYTESDLENAIIDNIENFLLELGKGFTFVGRQKRIKSSFQNFYIDLVFYNRLLNCFVLIDLKIGKLKHQDIGQMQMYVNYYDREIKTENEKPTIGIILSKEKDNFVVEYTLPKGNEQIFSKQYQLYLPNKDELQQVIQNSNI